MPAAGQHAFAIFALALVQLAGLVFTEVQHVEYGLLREKLEAAQAFFLLGVELQLPQRLVRFQGGFALLEQLEFAVQLGVLDLLAVLFQALEALFHHQQVAEHQLHLDVFQVAHRIDGPLLVRDGGVLEQAQHVGEGVHHPQAGQVARDRAGSPWRRTACPHTPPWRA